MPPQITEQAFTSLVGQTGLPLTAEQRRDIFEAYHHLEALVERVHAPLPREAEPALIFRAAEK